MKRFATLDLLPLALTACQISAAAQGLPPMGPDGGPPLPALLERASEPPVKREPQVIGNGLLAPSHDDVAQHKFLLSQSKTGLMRLLPRETFDWEMYQVDKKVKMRGGGAFFSFHYRSHKYGYGSDLSLEHGDLFVGFAGADYGMMTDLGDTVLEQIFVEDPRVTFLLDYKPPKREPEARAEAIKFRDTFTVDGVNYKRKLRAEVNHTYLLRSIIYHKSDTLVAFRVVRKDDDGGLTIAWKVLKQFSPKELTR